MTPSVDIVAYRIALRVGLALAWLGGTASADCLPRFRPKEGWLGGDAAYSVSLGDGRSLWLFGDTFVGSSTAATRAGAAMLANTIGISTCRGGRWTIRYHWRAGPRPFFEDAADGERYWPMDGVLHGGRAYLGLLRVARAPGTEGPLAFRFRGARLAVVENPRADPAEWRIEYRDWVSSAGVVPAAAAASEGGYVYFLTTIQEAPHPMFLTRLAWDGLGRPAEAWEYRSRGGGWKRDFDAADAAVLFAPGQTELSLRRRARTGWVAFMAGPGFPSTAIVVRRAARLEGPWGPPRVLDRLPVPGPGRFCYAVKEHAEGSEADSALVTYACNASSLADVTADMRLYFPRARRVRFGPGSPVPDDR